MVPDPEELKMARQADECYQKKHVPLTANYVANPAKHANMEDVINGKVTLEHADAITNYSGGCSAAVNGALRGQYIDLTVEVAAYDQMLTEALESLPPYNDEIVCRMLLHLDDTASYEAYFTRNINKVLNVPCYLSTSKEDWDWEKVVYNIKTLKANSHARDISRITNKADETEVLFCKNTNF